MCICQSVNVPRERSSRMKIIIVISELPKSYHTGLNNPETSLPFNRSHLKQQNIAVRSPINRNSISTGSSFWLRYFSATRSTEKNPETVRRLSSTLSASKTSLWSNRRGFKVAKQRESGVLIKHYSILTGRLLPLEYLSAARSIEISSAGGCSRGALEAGKGVWGKGQWRTPFKTRATTDRWADRSSKQPFHWFSVSARWLVDTWSPKVGRGGQDRQRPASFSSNFNRRPWSNIDVSIDHLKSTPDAHWIFMTSVIDS